MLTPKSPQLPLDLQLVREATFEQFLVGPNRAAVTALRDAAANASAPWPLLTGAAGLGKTHLLNAACHAAGDAGRRAMLIAAEQLLAHGVQSLSQLSAVELLALDDVDRLIGSLPWEQALFHQFNELREQGATLVLSSRLEPAALRPTLADLASRLNWGMSFTLQPLDETDRVALLRQRALSKGIELSDEVVSYLMRRAPRDAASLLALLARLEHASLVEQRRITVPFLRDQLPDLRRESD